MKRKFKPRSPSDRPTILGMDGKEIVLNEFEQRVAAINQRRINALGFDIDITTLTQITKKVTEQKFFEIAPADYLPVRVGEGAWSAQLTTYRSWLLSGNFESGIVNTGQGELASADAGIDALSVPVINWGVMNRWTLFDLEQAARSGNWDLVTEKEKSRKMMWDLGIQKVAFLGLSNSTNARGLYNQSGITTDTTTLPQPLSSLSPIDLKAFCATILDVYRSNCARTAWPTHFIIPESDYLGLAAPSSADFPLKSVLAMLEETFQVMTKKKDFKILPNAYGDGAYSGQAYQQYVLLNYDETSIRMDIPVDYTNSLANTLDNFQYQNVGYGQFTGVLAYRPLELYYLQFTP